MTFDPGAAAAPGSGVFGLPHTPEQARVVLLPVAFEATTSYGGGTARGPEAILAASRQIDLFDPLTGRPYEAGIAWLRPPSEIDRLNARARAAAKPVLEAGGAPGSDPLAMKVAEVNELCEELNALVEAEVGRWISQGKLVGAIGGDHGSVFGAIAATCRAYPGMGILHLDAHADLRVAFEGFVFSHASIMDNVARLPGLARLVQVGLRDVSEEEVARIRDSKGRIVAHFDHEIARAQASGTPFLQICKQIADELPADVYLSFDIDGLDPSLCPHTGTPVPGGLSFAQVNLLLEVLVDSGRHIVGLDLNEVAPGPDGDEWDANVGARLLYKMIGWMLKSQPRSAQSISNE
jgi:agmatinase